MNKRLAKWLFPASDDAHDVVRLVEKHGLGQMTGGEDGFASYLAAVNGLKLTIPGLPIWTE